MTTYRTGNAIGSTDPRDLYDNAENLDELVNSQDKAEHPDRLGVSRKTWHGMEEEFDGDQARRENEHDADQTRRESEFVDAQADKQQRFNLLLANSGYEYLADYAAGIEITEYNQVLRDTSGELWRAAATTELPYTTDGTGLPESGAFIAVGDADIRNDLAAGVGAGKGGLLVAGAVIYVNTIADLQALSTSELVDGQQASVRGTEFRWSASGSEWRPVGPVNPLTFGAKAEAGFDNSQPLKDWAAYISENNVSAEVLDGEYELAQSERQIIITGMRGRVVNFGRAVFKVRDGEPVVGDSSIFTFRDNHDCVFLGGVADANRENRTFSGVASAHTIAIESDNKRCTWWNMESLNAVADGWYVRSTQDPADSTRYPEDCTLRDCKGINAHRNNLSIIGSRRLSVIGGSYSGANGSSPEAGIDVEPNVSDIHGNDDLYFENVETSNNSGFGLMLAGAMQDTSYNALRPIITGLKGSQNLLGLLLISTATDVSVSGTRCGPHDTLERGAIDVRETVRGYCRIHDSEFVDVALGVSGARCIHTRSGIKVEIDTLNCVRSCTPVSAQGGTPSGGYFQGGVIVKNARVEEGYANLTLVHDNCEVDGFSAYRPVASTGRVLYIPSEGLRLENVYIEDSPSSVTTAEIQIEKRAKIIRNITFVSTAGTGSPSVALRIDAGADHISGITGVGGYQKNQMLYIVGSSLTNFGHFSGFSPNPKEISEVVPAFDIPAGGSRTITLSGVPTENGGIILGEPIFYGVEGSLSSVTVRYVRSWNQGRVNILLTNYSDTTANIGEFTWIVRAA